MIFLLFHILISTGFGLVVKHGQHRRLDLLTLGTVNYVVAALWFGLQALMGEGLHLSGPTLAIGIFGGISYVVSYLFLVQVLRYTGISIPMAIVRLSVLIPVLASIWVWHEMPNFWQVCGIALTCAALPCFNLDARNGKGRGFAGPTIMIGLLFLATGCCSLAAKLFHEADLPGQKAQFLFFLFFTTAVVAVSTWLWDRWRGGRRNRLAAAGSDRLPTGCQALPAGALLGLINVGGNFFLLLALERLPGLIVFPVASALGVMLTTVVAAQVWGERIGAWGRAGIALSIGAVALLNLG